MQPTSIFAETAKRQRTLLHSFSWFARQLSFLDLLMHCLHGVASCLPTTEIDLMVFLRRLYKCGFTVRLFTTEQLLFDADNVLFRKVLIDGHCLHHLLPPVKTFSIQLRPASHNCQLPICKYMLYKRSFLVRCLFNCH